MKILCKQSLFTFNWEHWECWNFPFCFFFLVYFLLVEKCGERERKKNWATNSQIRPLEKEYTDWKGKSLNGRTIHERTHMRESERERKGAQLKFPTLYTYTIHLIQLHDSQNPRLIHSFARSMDYCTKTGHSQNKKVMWEKMSHKSTKWPNVYITKRYVCVFERFGSSAIVGWTMCRAQYTVQVIKTISHFYPLEMKIQ